MNAKTVGGQACRPEDRSMLTTPAGTELVATAAAALADEPPDLVVRLLAAARDYGVAEDLRLLLGEAAGEVDRLETLAAVRDWAATSASVHLGGVIEEAQTVMRTIHDEPEAFECAADQAADRYQRDIDSRASH